MNWDQSFEAYPGPGDIGSVTCPAVKNILTEFYTRFSIEHTITEGVNPTATHTPGKCAVCDVTSNLPVSSGVLGAISFRDDPYNTLYYDDSAVMAAISGRDHGLYITHVLDESAHTQYILCSPIAANELMTGALLCQRVSGMDILEADYTAYPYPSRLQLILSRGAHKGVSSGGGNKHPDQSFGFGGWDFHMGRDKFKMSSGVVLSEALGVFAISSEFTLGEYSFFPYATQVPANCHAWLLPGYIDLAAAFPAGTISPKLHIYNNSAFASGVFIIEAASVDKV